MNSANVFGTPRAWKRKKLPQGEENKDVDRNNIMVLGERLQWQSRISRNKKTAIIPMYPTVSPTLYKHKKMIRLKTNTACSGWKLLKHLKPDSIDKWLSPDQKKNNNYFMTYTTSAKKKEHTKIKHHHQGIAQQSLTREEKHLKANSDTLATNHTELSLCSQDKNWKPRKNKQNTQSYFNMLNNKWLRANVFKQKGTSLFGLSTLQKMTQTSNGNNVQEIVPKRTGAKRSSLVDRLILKITNPDDCIEDYLLTHAPKDNFIKFTKQLNTQQDKITKWWLEVTKTQNASELNLKLYTTKIKSGEYHPK